MKGSFKTSLFKKPSTVHNVIVLKDKMKTHNQFEHVTIYK